MDEPRFGLEALEALATRALGAAGTRAEAAASVARALVLAEADGLASHGLSRLSAYAAQVRSGKVRGDAMPRAERVGTGAVRIDAGCGFAFPAIDLALEELAPLARGSVVAAAAIADSHHFGVAGHHVERLARTGLIGLVVGNSPAAMAVWGGRRGLLGTNPIAFACPRQGDDPLVIDLSLSLVARGKVMVAAQRGEAVPEGWGQDAQGRPTTDPKALLAGGTMLPMGDAKGAALALMVEILAAALTGSHLAFEATSFFDADGPPPRVGQFLLAIDPGPLSALSFAARLETLLGAIAAEPGARLPGARRFAARARARAEGIPLPAELRAEIERLADDGAAGR